MIKELKSINSQIKNGKMEPLKWTLSDLPITGETAGLYFVFLIIGRFEVERRDVRVGMFVQ